MHPTIPGMDSVYDLMLSIFKTMKSSCVPEAADFPICRSERLRNPISGTVMQTQAESDPPRNS